MTPPPLPLLRVAGTHREAGRQIGEATAEVLAAAAASAARAPGAVELAARYREVTARELPAVVDELDGAAEGAGVDPLALFAASIEEIWDGDDVVPPSQAGALARAAGRCSDLVACGPAAPDGHVWVAHTNDLAAESEASLVAIERRVEGEPCIFTVGIGPWLSVGFNDAGLSLTGNELSPNDERIGIPRLLQVRDVVARRTLAEAVEAALHPRRASSYNNLLAHRDGGVVSVEGSATDAELVRPSPRGTLAHTNHYAEERMRRYEGDPAYAERSAVRLRRARELGKRIAAAGATPERLRAALADHENAPDSLCRHPGAPGETKTVFWCVADVTAGAIAYGRGNPCDSEEQRYAFA